jgi:predicted lactoylglutathione lyase
MARKLFVNVAVRDLQASIEFFTKLGFTFDPNFTDEHATCMNVNDDAAFMLLDHARFADFTTKPIVDSTAGTEAIFSISADSREQVDELVGAALAAGGRPSQDKQDHGFMYGGSFQDPDGHLWEVVYMDLAAFAAMSGQGQ